MSQPAEKADPPKADAAADNDDKVSTSSSYKKLTSNLRQLEAKRRTFRRTLQQYERIKSKFTDMLAKLNKKEATEKDGAPAADPKKQQAIAAYRLLRNFCISFNTVYQAKKDEDRQEIPDKYVKEIDTLLGSDAADKFKKALKAETVDDSVKELPDQVSDAVVKGLLDFINKHDQEEIIKVLNKELDDLTADIDKLRGEQKTRKSTIKKEKVATEKTQQQKQAKKPKKINTDDQGKTTEQRFRDLIREVQQRVSQIKLEKDDYQTYSEVQSEVDNFLDEATTEIMAIKNGLRKRFENVQSGKGDKRKTQAKQKQRKPRAPRKGNDEGDNQHSVFSTAIQD